MMIPIRNRIPIARLLYPLLAILIAVPLSVGAAIFLAEAVPPKLLEKLKREDALSTLQTGAGAAQARTGAARIARERRKARLMPRALSGREASAQACRRAG